MNPGARPSTLQIGLLRVGAPMFFPSISSVKTALPPVEYARLLNALRTISGQYLVSAFDLAQGQAQHQELIETEVRHASDAGVVVLMDSGNYESYWKNAKAAWLPADFHRVLRRVPCAFAFGFDEQSPPENQNEHVENLCAAFQRDQAVAGNTPVIPIVHGATERLPLLCARLAARADVPMVAVAERWLGGGVFDRARAVVGIRQALDGVGRYVGLHLLGTGNPISMAIYAIAGADSFDGLEWCQTVVDHETGLLFHFSQGDFFQAQTSWGDSNFPFQARTLAHNLEFYNDWMRRLRAAMADGRGIEFCHLNFPQRVYVQCAAALEWEMPT